MKIILAALAAPLLLTGCASFTVPAQGVSTSGETFAGTATAKISGEGYFELKSSSGAICSGKYDAMDMAKTIIVPLSCSDGRTGKVIATRNAAGTGGSGTATLSNGTTAVFTFG